MASRYQIHLERIDPARNMHRFYALRVEPTLFGNHALVRQWGRIGTCGRMKTEFCGSETEALQRLLAMARAKLSRNYRPH